MSVFLFFFYAKDYLIICSCYNMFYSRICVPD